MANVVAKNAKESGDLLVWLPEGINTPVVYSYTCSVDSHKVVSAVRLQRDSGGSATGATITCPIHQTTLGSESATSV